MFVGFGTKLNSLFILNIFRSSLIYTFEAQYFYPSVYFYQTDGHRKRGCKIIYVYCFKNIFYVISHRKLARNNFICRWTLKRAACSNQKSCLFACLKNKTLKPFFSMFYHLVHSMKKAGFIFCFLMNKSSCVSELCVSTKLNQQWTLNWWSWD